MNPAVDEWVSKAEGDFATAGRELRARKAPNYDAVCFHAQQCAEKYLKALLVSKKTGFPMTHDLLLLNNLCSSTGIFLEVAPRLLNDLSDFAVRTRYPGEEPTLSDAKEAIETTKLIRSFAKKLLGS